MLSGLIKGLFLAEKRVIGSKQFWFPIRELAWRPVPLTLSRHFLLWKTRREGHELSPHFLFKVKGQPPTSNGQLEDVEWYWMTKSVSGWIFDFIDFD